MGRASVFENRKWVLLFAGSAALSWACAFPLIKLGLADFGIAGTDIGGKALFAGARFLLAGLVVLAVAKLCGRSFAVPRGKTRWQLVLFGLVNTALHYFFFYLGVSNSPGGRASILDSLGTFLLILAAAVVFREKLTLRSIFGCLLGFSGIVLINLGSTAGQFTLSGDGMLLCSSVCAMAGGLLTRVVTRKMDPLVATGHSLALGGALLIPAGLLMGAHPVGIHLKGLLILAALVAVSAVGFSFYNQLLRYHPVGQIAIYNAFIPVLGVVLSCLLLGEPFSWRYLLSGALVTVGICAVNLPAKARIDN